MTNSISQDAMAETQQVLEDLAGFLSVVSRVNAEAPTSSLRELAAKIEQMATEVRQLRAEQNSMCLPH